MWAVVPRCAHPSLRPFSPVVPRTKEPRRSGTRPHRGSAAPHSLKGIPPKSGAWRAASPRGPTLQARKGGAAGTHGRGSPRPRSAVRLQLSGGPNAEATAGGAARRGLGWCTRAGSVLSRVVGKTQAPRGRPHCSACRARPGGAWPCGLKPRWRGGNGRGTTSAATAAAAPHAGGVRSPHLWRRA